MTGQPRLTREKSQAQTRRRLLDAARRIFAREGYGGAGVDAIAAEAGYSKGAFYSNFATKEAIFLELLSCHMAMEADQLQRLFDPARDVDDILSGLDHWLDSMNADADWALLAVEIQLHARRSPSFAAEFDALHARHRGILGALIARLFAHAGKLSPIPPADLAGALIALAHGMALQNMQRPSTDPAGPMIKMILRSLIATASGA